MHRRVLQISGSLVAALLIHSASAASDNQPPIAAATFLKRYCIDCHGERKQKGDHRFDALIGDDSPHALEQWQEILDQLNLSEMPPEDDPQPTKTERLAMIDWLTTKLDRARATQPTKVAAMRRLTNTEYRATIRDLLHLNVENFDPSEGFPTTIIEEGFDKQASQLKTSPMLLHHYLKGAERALQKATVDSAKPTYEKYLAEGPGLHGGRDVFTYRNGLKDGTPPCADVTTGVPGVGRCFSGLLRKGVPHDGEYLIRVKAQAVHRDHRIRKLRYDPIVRMEILAGDAGVRLHKASSADRSLKAVELSDEVETYELRAWLDKGFAPVVIYKNGAAAGRGLIARMIAKDRGINSQLFDERIVTREAEKWVGEYYKGPRIRVYSIEIEGPLLESWPPASHRSLYGAADDSPSKQDRVRQALISFGGRAYRRPLRDGELAPSISLATNRLANGASYEAAVRAGAQAILASPGFLYLGPYDTELGAYDLASRLSYFLWNTMPDKTLLELAASGKLKDPDVLRKQAKRMLDDPKSSTFLQDFTKQWLHLSQMDLMPPDESRFRDYYLEGLAATMKAETHAYVDHLVRENLSVRYLVDSDFTFLNAALASHYRIPGVQGETLRKVKLPGKAKRGGIITHGSLLTATSNGVETSPVTRGVRILEAILGTPPSPPPPDVDPLAPDIRGATSIREQLRKHREVETCNECHKKIDPYGFAFEHFDPVGRWRNTYPGRIKIDASGRTPQGQAFNGVDQLQKILASREKQIATSLAGKMLSYAVGRELGYRERPAVDRIVRQSEADEFRMRDLILTVVQDQQFQMR